MAQNLHYVRPAIQNYAWGCKGDSLVATAATASGLPVDSTKEYAEAWFGTHTSAPSLLIDGDNATPLSPSLELPLLKILSIRAPLSIQLHPDSGIAPFLNKQFPTIYKDPCAKPEMVIPITSLVVMAGIQQYDRLRAAIAAVPAIAELIGTPMKDSQNPYIRETETIRVLSKWLHLSSEQAKPIVQKALDQINALEMKDPLFPKDIIMHLNKSFPLDVGVLAPIFLNVLKLAPGEALFVPPNVLHAYIQGDAVEIMNCSDNVIRAGLTPKLRDADLLCKLITAEESGNVSAGEPTGEFTRVYRPADRVRDFELTAIDLPPHKKVALGALPVTSLLLCSSGSGSISSLNSLNITPGQCILCPAGVSVEIATKDNNVIIYRANQNQSPLPDNSVIANLAEIVFKDLQALSGEELSKKALHAAELLRSVDQFSNNIWFRAAAYLEIGKALAKSSNSETNTYAASCWLQKAAHVCTLAGDAVNDSPVEILQAKTVVPSKIKLEAETALNDVLSRFSSAR